MKHFLIFGLLAFLPLVASASWDVFVQDFPAGATTKSDIPDNFQPGPIGTRSDLIKKIKAVVPKADFSDPSWGKIEGKDFSIEINLGDDEELTSFAFHVRGSDEAALIVARILKQLNLRALDSGTGEFLELKNPAKGLRIWRGYNDKSSKKGS